MRARARCFADVPTSRDFFATYFGFRCVAERGRDALAVMVDDSRFVLTLNNFDKAAEVAYPGAFHIGFMQDSLEYGSRTHHSNMDTRERLQAADLKQIAVVEAIFVYNAAMRDEMIPRKPLPHPERLEEQNKHLQDLYPTAIK